MRGDRLGNNRDRRCNQRTWLVGSRCTYVCADNGIGVNISFAFCIYIRSNIFNKLLGALRGLYDDRRRGSHVSGSGNVLKLRLGLLWLWLQLG
jgi:hypothetical protein